MKKKALRYDPYQIKRYLEGQELIEKAEEIPKWFPEELQLRWSSNDNKKWWLLLFRVLFVSKCTLCYQIYTIVMQDA